MFTHCNKYLAPLVVLLFSSVAYATCFTTIVDNKVCTTCCYGNECTTTCQ